MNKTIIEWFDPNETLPDKDGIYFILPRGDYHFTIFKTATYMKSQFGNGGSFDERHVTRWARTPDIKEASDIKD